MSNYQKTVQWSDEDNCYIGTCPGLFLGGVHGRDKNKVSRELDKVIRSWERYLNKKNSRTHYKRRKIY